MFLCTILVILVCPCFILCETYYITPNTSNATCPFETCLTLSQVAALFIESDISLIFLPGNYSLDIPLVVENGNSFRMDKLGNSSDDAKIECKHPKSFNIEVSNISDIHMNGLQFVGCTSSLHLVEQIWITGCQFNSSNKTALTFVESSVYIANSSFNYNQGGSYQLELKSLVGGALFARNSEITVLNSFIQRNSAESGGAIYCHSNERSHFTLLNSTFAENTAKCYGGVLYSNGCKISINNCTFVNNSAVEAVEAGRYMRNRGTCPSHHDGGVLALFKSSVSIHRSAFTQNRANNRGGVIFMEKSNVVSAENKFYHNNAQQGGIIRGYRSNFNDKQSNFSKNEASDVAGVLYCHGGSHKCIIIFIKSVVSLNNATNGKVIDVINGNISIINSTVMRNFAAAVIGLNIRIEIINSEFTNNIADGFHTTMLDLFQVSQVVIVKSNFTNSTSYGGQGAVLRLESDRFVETVVIINGSRFSNNAVYRDGNGGVISCNTHEIKIVIVECQFENNMAEGKGGVLYNEKISPFSINVTNCVFHNNSANDGGVFYAHSIRISISNSEFKANSAPTGAVMFLSENSLVKMKDVVINGNTASRGTIYLMECTAILSGNLSFSGNLGSFLAHGSTVNITDYIKFSNSSQKSNTALQEGGAITAFQSEIMCYGKCTFSKNSAEYGGAIHATESKLQFYGEIEIVGNRAANSGGGIYLQQSEILCNNSNITLAKNTALHGGGGIYAVGSTVRLDFLFINNLLETSSYYYTGSQLAFLMNKAKEGGGLYLESNAKLYILMKIKNSILFGNKLAQLVKSSPLVQYIHALTFEANTAVYGGAIYVADNTNFATCTSVPNKPNSTTSTIAECFFQLLLLNNVTLTVESVYHKSYLIFEKNVATISGATLYGGLLDRCTVSPFANTFAKEKDTLSLFKDGNGTDISSAPIRLCFCRNNQPDCSYQPSPIKIKKGDKFTVTVTAVDQASQTAKNATIRSLLLSKFGGLGENQLSQITSGTCTDLHYEIFSPNTSETLIMYADGPCKDALPSQGRLDIHFSPCSCPVGFQPSLNPSEATRCTCECDPQLNGYITDCYPQTGDLVRKGNYWIAYLNTSTKNHYLIYPNCPLDYCLPASSRVTFNFEAQDAQCTNDHSGKLCGPCKPGLSLSIGSSRCIPCPKHWPAILVTISVAALIGGILLIAAILIFNLTVAVGTLNGIILYANIVHANANVFLPFRKTNFITVFIAWLNLELGFDACFFDGMDVFWKTLLQLAFPMYLITLLVVIIIVSEHYAWFARLFEKKNPVATLATLVLLSYVKLLHAIIASFSFIILKYPDGSKETVWLPDATVGYFRGRHVFLFFIAFLILLAGIAYTALLFSWQWLLHCKNKTLTKVITYHRLHMFLETYHAPYNYEYRYWTGLLLFIRAALYVVAAVNVSNDPEVNLLAVAIAMSGLLLLKGFANKSIYKTWPLDVLEISCYINILCFCLATLYALAGNRDGTVIAYISGSLIVLEFAAVLCVELLSKPAMRLWSKCKQRMQHREILYEAEPKEGYQFEITYSEVPEPSREEVPLSCLIDNQNQCKDDNESADDTVSYHQMTN